MNWQKWVLVAWFALGAIATVTQIAKPRKPITAEAGAASLLISVALILLAVTS